MDWDWEDGSPSDAPLPRRAPDEPDGEPDLRQPERPVEPAEPESPLESAAPAPEAESEPEPEPPEDDTLFPAPPLPDSAPEYVLPGRPGVPATGEPLGPEVERPWARTVEAAESAEVADASGPDDHERRPRASQDRAAAREQRRRQLRRRRLVALAILIAIVVLIVVLIVRGCGGSDAGAAAAAACMIAVDRRLLVAPERP